MSKWTKALLNRLLCRFGIHHPVADTGPWCIKCSRCGRTGHYYETNHWDKDESP